ncbi:hypothetical protein BH18ACT2_BH18ACT2_20580 [soil metagenome]
MRSRVLGALVVLVSSVLVVVGAGRPAHACSCAGLGMAEAIAQAEVTFVGTTSTRFTDDDYPDEYEWDFEVTEAIKGDVPPQLTLIGYDWRGGCGTDYGQFTGPIVVIARRQDDRYVGQECTPTISADALDATLTPLPAPDGQGPVAAVAAFRYRWADVVALDAAGRVLAWGDLGGSTTQIAVCPGTSTAAAIVWGDRRADLRLVDLTKMQIVGEPLAGGIDPGVEKMVCVPTADPAAPLVVLAGGGTRNDGTAAFGAVGAGGELLRRDLTGTGDVVLGADGTVITVSGVPGGSIVRHAPPDLEPSAELVLEPRESGIGAALDADEDRLAVLVDQDGREARGTWGASAVLPVDLTDGALTRGDLIDLPPGGPGAAQQVRWLDDETLAVTRVNPNTIWFDVVGLDGTLILSTDIGWGWGGAVMDGRLVRAVESGLQSIDRTGAITAMVTFDEPMYGRSGFVATVTDGPTIPALAPPPPQRRPMSAPPQDPWTCRIPILSRLWCHF